MKSIAEIPFIYRSIFPKFKNFNEIQSSVFNDVFHSNKSIIVSAPTGSGKTVIFELAIIRLLLVLQNEIFEEDFKIVYVAPIKALCSEKYIDWCEKFNQFGLSVLEVTGDSEISDFSELSSAKLIITTPEKWDSLTRKWKDNEDIVSTVKLFMVDEVHLLNEDIRGPILEAIVSRMKTIQFGIKSCGRFEMNLRFIAVSATIPNIEDLAEWIGNKNPEKICFFQFSEDKRPVKLERHIIGFNTTLPSFKFDMSLNYKLSPIIRKFCASKPTLIFCSSRKSVEMASTVLFKEYSIFPLSDNQKTLLFNLSKRIKDSKLKSFMMKGIAYHHAGLIYEDRLAIEEAFRTGLILILVSTNTLAMGVNLPAHLVIIKSTEFFVNGQAIQYSESAILQMIGRAGRPQYDLSGVAVILTQQKYVKKYENLMNGCTPIESHLHKHLAEHLNSEIVLQTITDLDIAMEWIRSTFLYVRACKLPKNYGFKAPAITKDKIEKKLEEMCLIQINCLETNGLITKDQTFGLSIKSTPFGKLMARYYISFETMKLFRQIRGNESFLETFYIIVRCKEFTEFTLRVSDKKLLNELNNKPIRFPIKGKIKTNENKVSCLIQANFDNMHISDPSMIQDSMKMIKIGERVSKCFYEFIRLSEKKLTTTNGMYKILLHSITLMKCFKAKLWENSVYVSKQLHRIGTVYSRALVDAGKTTFKSILNSDTQSLEMILNKPPPFGTEIHNVLLTLPVYQLDIIFDKVTRNFRISVSQTNTNFRYDGSNCYLVVGNTDNNLILFSDKLANVIQEEKMFYRNITISNTNVEAINIHLIHENLVGVDESSQIIVNPVIEEENKKKITKKTSKRKVQTKLNPVPCKRFQNSENYAETTSNTISQIELLDDDEIFMDLSSQIAHQNISSDQRAISTRSPDIFEETGNNSKLFVKQKPNYAALLSNYKFNEKPKFSHNESITANESISKSLQLNAKNNIENSNDLTKIFDEDFYLIDNDVENTDLPNNSLPPTEVINVDYDDYINAENDIIWDRNDEFGDEIEMQNLTNIDETNISAKTLNCFKNDDKENSDVHVNQLGNSSYYITSSQKSTHLTKACNAAQDDSGLFEQSNNRSFNCMNEQQIWAESSQNVRKSQNSAYHLTNSEPIDLTKTSLKFTQMNDKKCEVIDLRTKFSDQQNKTNESSGGRKRDINELHCGDTFRNNSVYYTIDNDKPLALNKRSKTEDVKNTTFCAQIFNGETIKNYENLPFHNNSNQSLHNYNQFNNPLGLQNKRNRSIYDGLNCMENSDLIPNYHKQNIFKTNKVSYPFAVPEDITFSKEFQNENRPLIRQNRKFASDNLYKTPMSLQKPTSHNFYLQNQKLIQDSQKYYGNDNLLKNNNVFRDLYRPSTNIFNSDNNYEDQSLTRHCKSELNSLLNYNPQIVKRLGLSKPKTQQKAYNIAKPKNIFGRDVFENVDGSLKQDFVSAKNTLQKRKFNDEFDENFDSKSSKLSTIQQNFLSDNENFSYNTIPMTTKIQSKPLIDSNYKTNNLSYIQDNKVETSTKNDKMSFADFKNDLENRKLNLQKEIRCNKEKPREHHPEKSFSSKINNSNISRSTPEPEFQNDKPIAQSTTYLESNEAELSNNENNDQSSQQQNQSKSANIFNLEKETEDLYEFENLYVKKLLKFRPKLTNFELLKTIVESHDSLDPANLTEVKDIDISDLDDKAAETESIERTLLKERFFKEDDPKNSKSNTPTNIDANPVENFQKVNFYSNIFEKSPGQDISSKETDIFHNLLSKFDRDKLNSIHIEEPIPKRRSRKPNPYRLHINSKVLGFPCRKPMHKTLLQHQTATEPMFSTVEERKIYKRKLEERLNSDPNYNEESYKRDLISCLMADNIQTSLQNSNNQHSRNEMNNFQTPFNDINQSIGSASMYGYNDNQQYMNRSFTNSRNQEQMHSYFDNINFQNNYSEPLIEPKIEIDFDSEERNEFNNSPNILQQFDISQTEMKLEPDFETDNIFINYNSPMDETIKFSQNLPF